MAILLLRPLAARSVENEEEPAQVETFTIDGTIYKIPKPWAGNRITAPSPAAMDFRKIPTAHTHNGSAVYIAREACTALEQMMLAAEQDGIYLEVESGFRSYQFQKKIFTRLLNEGRTYEDMVRYVAPPGYSQHALGTAVDFFPSNWEFAQSPAYTWLQEHGNRFGFSETYPEKNVLGYPWEAWHWNFSTDQLATSRGESPHSPAISHP